MCESELIILFGIGSLNMVMNNYVFYKLVKICEKGFLICSFYLRNFKSFLDEIRKKVCI